MTISQTISTFSGTVPDKDTQTPAEFSTNADALGLKMTAWPTEYNTYGTQANALAVTVNGYKTDALAAQAAAETAQAVSQSNANYAGDWTTLGAVAGTVPYSVSHDSKNWQLIANLADISTVEPGVTAGWATYWKEIVTIGSVKLSAITGTTTLDSDDKGKLVDVTSGTFTLSFTAAATLDDGWFCYIKNSGTGEITLDPDGTETIDGLTSYKMYPGESRLVQCTGTAFNSVIMSGFTLEYTSGINTFTKPPGYKSFDTELWGAGAGGGSGGKNNVGGATGGGGGGGGAYKRKKFLASEVGTTETVTIGDGGLGGAAQATNGTAGNHGGDGGDTSFGSLSVAYGGGYGTRGEVTGVTISGGGGGGGSLSSGSAGAGGSPRDGNTTNTTTVLSNAAFGGAYGPSTNGEIGAASGYGGASGGMAVSDYLVGIDGGSSVYGGAGGGGGAGNAASDNDGGDGGSQVGASAGGGAGGDASESTVPPDQTALGLGGGGGYFRNSATQSNSAGAAGGIASGGGGGGAGLSAVFDSGEGGNGGDGLARITGGMQ